MAMSPPARARSRRPRAWPQRAGERLVGVLAALALQAALPSVAQAKDAPKAAKHHRSPTARTVVPSASPAPDGAAASVGLASVYARKLVGRRMANGAPMRADEHNAASTALPLGSTALVTNLANGERAVVTITDRGPFVRGRIIDLSPHTAQQLGIRGLARVEVAPVVLPPIDRSGFDVVLAAADRDLASPPH